MFADLARASGGEMLAICILVWFALGIGFVVGAGLAFNAYRSRLADLLATMSHKDRVFVTDALERAADALNEPGEMG